jgi:hypothetical protein
VSFSYSESLGTTTDKVRAILGDIASPGLRSDEAILATALLFADSPSPLTETVSWLALSLANEYRTRPDRFSEQGGISVSWSDRVKGWDQLVRDIRAGKVSFDPAVVVLAGASSWQAPVAVSTDSLEPAPVVG